MNARQAHRALAPDRWQRIQDVLADAIDCDADARGRLLAERCDSDPELREEVETLLAAHEGAGLVDALAPAMAPATSWARTQAVGWEGSRVGQYSVEDLLGAGGMGLVYRARDERLGRQVALKFLSPHLTTAAARQRFLLEARAAAALEHLNVCTIHEIGETGNGQLFIAMPLYEGDTLQERLRRGRLPFAEAAPIALQIARGLARAHEHGIVHCDVKPSNVMLLADGTVKILDFGIAKMDTHPAAGEGAPIGSIAYMSPEHVRGDEVDPRSDIWSLGILLHEMLTGLRPFDGRDRPEVADAILTDDPDLVATSHPDVPAGMDDVLRRALAKAPEHRYPTMTTMAADLAALRAASERGIAGALRDPESHGSERRRAAVLITTVSQYGALVEHLAPAAAARLVAEIRDAAVDVVRRHGGLVNQAIGEEIVSLFGVPAAHDDDELRAVRAAIELHARIAERADPGPGVEVRVQSGIHVGPMLVQRLHDGPRRYAIVGGPAQLASRLAGLAAPGCIVISPDCQRLVAPFVHTEPCPTVVLAQDSQPITPFHVTGETGLETRLEASEQSGLSPYVGRQSQMADLEALVERARAGAGGIVAIVGDAGAGKSRLLHELRRRLAGADGVRMLNGRCRGYGDVAPYCPFLQIIGDALCLPTLADGGSDEIVKRIRTIDESLDVYLPLYLHLLSVSSDSRPLPRHLQGGDLEAALLDALAAMMAALSRRTPVVVLFEDWHWADAASRAALDRMTEIVADHALLFVVTSRPEPGLEERPAAGTRIDLEPLDFEASGVIMRAALHVDRVSDELARRVFERSGGNPFFLEQICCALVEQGAVVVRDAEAVVDGGMSGFSLPDTVQTVIGTRLDKLEPDAREVLRVAAVIGREFQRALLAEALPPDVDLAAAVERLEAVGLIEQTSVVPDVVYRFKHVLTREVSYAGLLEYQRRSWHEVIGRAIAFRHADRIDEKAALLARHFGSAGAWSEAVRYGRRAADRATALSQFSDALAMRDRVLAWLEQLPDDAARRELTTTLLLQQERECETLGLRSRQREIIDALIAGLAPHGRSSRLGEAYLRQGDLLTLLKQFDAADRALTKALYVSRDCGDAALERNTLRSFGLLRSHEGRLAEALSLTELALSIDRGCGDQTAVAGDLTNLGNILKGLGAYPAARVRLFEALEMPSIAQDPRKRVVALHNLANVHRATGDLDAALSCLRRADGIARAHLLPIQRSFHLTSIAHIQLQTGDLDSALDTYREAVALSRRARHAEGLAQSLRTLGDVLVGLGRSDEALPCLQEAAQWFAQLEDPVSETEMWHRTATVHERSSRAADAARAWDRVRSLSEGTGDAHAELDALEGAARALRQLNASPEECIRASAAALDLASRLGEGSRALALRNALGILEWTRGRYADALGHYEHALRLAHTHGGPGEEGLILNSLGVTLMRLDRPEDARAALEESLLASRATGERLLEAHALAALGQIDRAAGELSRAAEYFQQSLELRRSLDDTIGEGWMMHRLADTWTALGNETAAKHAAGAAVRIATGTGDPGLLSACAAIGLLP